ncbi:zinc finger protein Pegasus isoform X3 [Apodemus sylvaticus]|uniref:zinc finger protein Pegasus isoform X3 n=1 Tax=Apodemus sylvaticus TaxID=10129 RepID=UPI002242AB15|nr:zinc finger protein Pegasus isoform X3 [Apodemus sylvaticus]
MKAQGLAAVIRDHIPQNFVRKVSNNSCLDLVIQFIKMLSIRVFGKQWEKGRLQAWSLHLVPFGPICWTCPAGTDGDQNGLDHPSVEVSLDENSGMLVDGFERTFDGKLKCRYCNYASKGTARLIEHIRIHTGEKPHRCHLCPFASAYERHLEAHMRSHTGEKPYKCELCSFRCSDRSNLSHHRRRKHKMVPIKAGQLSSLPPENQNPASPDVDPCPDEKPFMIQQPSAQAVVSAVSASIPQSSSPTSPEPRPSHSQRNYSPVAGPSSEPSAHTSTPSIGNSQPSTPAPTLPVQDPQLLHHCQHCDMYFADNILYTIHMGCHGYENPFQCNICGCKCKNKYDFACHFARGQHNQH